MTDFTADVTVFAAGDGDMSWSVLFRERMWSAYVVLCLVIWLMLMLVPGNWALTLAHWPMTLVMIAGSLVAGSTPMGGGTIAFPALVLGFHRTPAMARDFGLAIQSVGMTSAMLFIIKRGIPVERRILGWACAGGVIGLALGTYLLAAWVPSDWVKLLFATLWLTFGTWLVTGTAKATSEPRPPIEGTAVIAIGLGIGIVGGAVASLIGVGVEMLVYATLVLRFGWGPKAAVPTAVCATALVSPVGMLLRYITVGINPGVFPDWAACVPLVIFGAPLGAYISTRMPRSVLLKIIGLLVVVQFGFTVNQVRPSLELWTGVVGLAGLGGAGLWMLAPKARAREDEADDVPDMRDMRLADDPIRWDAPEGTRREAFVPPPPRETFAPPPPRETFVAPPAREAFAARPPRETYTPPRDSFTPPPFRDPFPTPSIWDRPTDAGVSRLNVAYWCRVTGALHDARAIEPGAPFAEAYHRLQPAMSAVSNNDPDATFVKFAVSGQPRTALAAAIGVLTGDPARTAPITVDEVGRLRKLVGDYQAVLEADLQGIDTYYVRQLGAFSTTSLIEAAEVALALPSDALPCLTEDARKDLREAGRCLVFQLPTAAGFHVARATEITRRQYIRALSERQPDPRVTSHLSQVKDLPRNPLIHPDVTLAMPEAVALWSACTSLIAAMVMEIAKLKLEGGAHPAAEPSRL